MNKLIKEIVGEFKAMDDSVPVRKEQIKTMVDGWRITYNLLSSYYSDRRFPAHLKDVASYLMHDGNAKVRACNRWLDMSNKDVNVYAAALDIINLYTFYSMAEVVIELLEYKYFKG